MHEPGTELPVGHIAGAARWPRLAFWPPKVAARRRPRLRWMPRRTGVPRCRT